MNERNSALHWSIPCGTLFATSVRISIWFPLVFVVLCFRLGVPLGGLFGLILFASVLLHEFGHVFAARGTGGSGDEILLWPLGGLAFVRPADRLSARLWTSAAGPFVNLLLCLVSFWPVYTSGMLSDALHPLRMPAVDLENGPMLTNLVVLLFVANWLQLVVNLIPIYPLDGGQMVHAVLASRMGNAGTSVYLRIGFVVAIIGTMVGLIMDDATVVFIAAVILVFNMRESVQHQVSETYDDSFMGYDFSQGYTSLEGAGFDEDDEPAPRKPGWLERWRTERRERKRERESARDAADEARLDELLDKVQSVGMDGLTAEERRFLERTSQRIRRSRDA